MNRALICLQVINPKKHVGKSIILALILWLLGSCKEQSNFGKNTDPTGSSNPPDSVLVLNEPNMRHQEPIALGEHQKEQRNDSFIVKAKESFIRNGDLKSISSLDSMAHLSDGALANDISYAATELFHENFKGFIEFIYAHPESALIQYFVFGMSEELVVYEGLEREVKIKDLKDMAYAKCQEAGFNHDKIKFVEGLLKEVNPAMFD